MSVSRYSPERTPQPTSRPGSPSSERAAKPLAHALDQTLSILMDERVGGYERRFEEMERRLGGFEEIERRFQTQERQIDSLAGRVEQLERDGGSASLDERFAQHLSETERMIKSELKEVEALTDRICRPVLESIGDKAREMERLINEDAAKRQAEMQEMIDELNRRAPESLKQRLRLIEEALAHVLGLDLVAAQQPGEDYTVTVERTLHEFNEELREEEEEERQQTRGERNSPPRRRGGSSPQRGERASHREERRGSAKPASGIMGQLKELQERVDEMEAAHGQQTLEERFAQQLEEVAAQTDRICRPVLESIEDKASEMGRLFEDEVSKRQAEMQEVNEVLKALEEMIGALDAEKADKRRHQIESQLRRTIFRMKQKTVSKAFNSWVAFAQDSKRARQLATNEEHRHRMDEMLERIEESHETTTKRLEESLRALSERVEDGLQDAGMRETLDEVDAQLQKVAEELRAHIEEYGNRVPETLKKRLRLIEEALAHVLGLDLVAAQQPGEDYTVTVERTLHEFNEELREEEEEERQPTRGDYNAPPRHRGGSSPQRGERTSALRSVSPERGSGRGKPASGIMGQLKELQDRMDEMEDSEKLTQIETLVQQQIKTFESDLEGKASLADLEALEDEAAKRQAEMEEVNELLVALEELMNSRDAESAEQRQHRIESQVRRTIFHMQRRNVANAFNTWVAHTKQVKRQRHLLSTSIGGWRNRMLSRYFRPWAAMCKSPARARRGCLALSSLTTPDAGV